MRTFINGVTNVFLGIQPELWSFYRRHSYRADYAIMLDELRAGEAALMSALTSASQGSNRLDRIDRVALLEIIDQVRNYIDHIEQEYI